jgi:hypothetical protein
MGGGRGGYHCVDQLCAADSADGGDGEENKEVANDGGVISSSATSIGRLRKPNLSSGNLGLCLGRTDVVGGVGCARGGVMGGK